MSAVLKQAWRLAGALAFVFLVAAAGSATAQQGNPHLMLEVTNGTIDIELLPELAPKHVERIVELAGKGFYDGIVFHRVIEGFMAQTGDPTGTGGGGSDLPDVVAEFNEEPFVRGVVGAARTNDPDTFNSQFFITFGDASFLNGQYTVFGKVVSGMEFVDAIKKGDPQSGAMSDPDKILAAKIAYPG